MRLLSIDQDDNLAWTEFSPDKIPPYAILSHTWGAEEVTFHDLVQDNGRGKAGRRKIEFCGRQAACDGLRYFWVDTCCIDKRNNTELTKAINSMFRWYRNAAVCYAYLSDVSTPASDPSAETSQSGWEADFRSSKWFTRGWTLQELLAPSSVIFYSSQHKMLGDKKSLAPVIHEITGIPLPALDGHDLNTFSVTERMSWAANRETTEDEDGAYCLLGIFSIFMPLIYGEGKENARKRLQREIDALPVTVGSTRFTVPFERNLRFTGREPILADLEGKLFRGEQTTKMAIVGLGGIGKTQLALELAYRTREKHRNCSVFWIPATDVDSLHQAYRDVAQQLCIPGWDEEKTDIKKLVQTQLSQADARPWLLVFDNADNVSMWIRSSESEPGSGGLKEYLPRSKQGCIVFTTRDKKTAVKLVGHSFIEVPEMDEDGAMQLLQKSSAEPIGLVDQRDAKALLRELTYLPLAIVQAAAYINENSLAPSDYLSLLGEQDADVIDLLSEEFEDEGRYQSAKNPVATTWLISFEQIRRRDPLAADYLSFISCIDRKDIPQWLLPTGASRKKEMEAIGTLRAYSFINKRGEETVFDLHRLVHLAIRSWLQREGELSRWSHVAVQRLDDLFPDDEHQNRAQWRVLLPHAAHALRLDGVAKDDRRRLDLAKKYASCLRSDGRYREAEKAFEEGVETSMKAFGKEHPDTLTSMANLASTYWNQVRWKEAEELVVRVLEVRMRVLGKEHPDTLHSLADIALVYRYLGRRKEAEELGIRALEARKRVLGEEHPDTLDSLANLASTYSDQGRWEEAEELEVRAMEAMVRVLGEVHPYTLTSMGNLALTYWNQGRWKEAEELEVRVVEARKRVLGEEHPFTLTSVGNLAITYRDQGRWREAEELEVRVTEARKRALGEEHPETLTSMGNLALTYWTQGRWKEAEELGLRVLEARKRVLREEHPETLTSMANLALTYWTQGRWKEAEELGLRVLEASKRVFGEEHPSTLISMNNLAFTWKRQGRHEQAINLMRECAQLGTQILGADHPDTLASTRSLDLWTSDSLGTD